MIARTASAPILLAALTLGVASCAADQPDFCKALPGTREELSATPRDDDNIEFLALRLSKGIAADEAVYERLTRDITAIRAQSPAVRSVRYFPPYQNGLYVALDDESYKKAKSGQFQAWECLNQHFGVVEQAPGTMNSVTLLLRGRYKLEQVANLYRRVPGVTMVQPLGTTGDGPTIYVTPDDATWHYVFDNASGDCPAGCTVHDVHYFVVKGDGSPQIEGTWSSESSEAPPAWVNTYLFGARKNWRTAQTG